MELTFRLDVVFRGAKGYSMFLFDVGRKSVASAGFATADDFQKTLVDMLERSGLRYIRLLPSFTSKLNSTELMYFKVVAVLSTKSLACPTCGNTTLPVHDNQLPSESERKRDPQFEDDRPLPR